MTVKEAIALLSKMPDHERELLIRCHDCGGTLLYKETTEGYEVFHICADELAPIAARLRQAIASWPHDTIPKAAPDLGASFYRHVCSENCRRCKAEAILGGKERERDDRVRELSDRITQYLGVGGLWNPELMEHDKVRQLLMDIREAILGGKR